MATPAPKLPSSIIAKKVMSFARDPLGFVRWCYPWGQPGPLLDFKGPDTWQAEFLAELGRQIKAKKPVIRIAVGSGHGVGKTCLSAWLVHWFLSTRPTPQCVVTANTQNQLTTKTWRELAKWKGMAINGDWFEWTATKYVFRAEPETWYASAIPWSKNNSEAFAGTHERPGLGMGYVMMLFDEASAIDDIIWEVAEGALDEGAIWLAFGNPTRNTGRFRECWTKYRERWTTMNVDARESMMAPREKIAEWAEDYGENSDFFRVRVRGLPPELGVLQFISSGSVRDAMERNIDMLTIPRSTPKIMSLDVAREGDDKAVWVRRYGRIMLPEVNKWRIPDLMQLSSRVATEINDWDPDVIFVDAIGMGAGVFDRLIQLGYDNVVPVKWGEKAVRDDLYYNQRVEAWSRMKDWLEVADIPEDQELEQDLIGPEFAYDNKMRVRLERKRHMKERGLPSPDVGDALAMTFAQPVVQKKDDYYNDELEPEYV